MAGRLWGLVGWWWELGRIQGACFWRGGLDEVGVGKGRAGAGGRVCWLGSGRGGALKPLGVGHSSAWLGHRAKTLRQNKNNHSQIISRTKSKLHNLAWVGIELCFKFGEFLGPPEWVDFLKADQKEVFWTPT